MGLFPIKQFGRPRSGTNYTRWVIENNFSNARVLQNIFGGKHLRYNAENFEKDGESWLTHHNAITDTHRDEIEKFKRGYKNGSMIFVVTMKPLDKYLSSLFRFKDTALGPDDKNAIERGINLYNSINANYIKKIPAPSIFFNYEAIKTQLNTVISFFINNGLEPLGGGCNIELNYKLAANTDKKIIWTVPESESRDFGQDDKEEYFCADIRNHENKKIREILDEGVHVRLRV